MAAQAPQQQQRQPNAKPPQQLRKPMFVTVDQLLPGTAGHNLVVKVVSTNLVMQRARPGLSTARQVRISESVVGDQTGVIVFTARNEQGQSCSLFDHFNVGTSLILRNAKIDMFRGSMRLAVDRWGRIEVTEPADFTVKEDNNLSHVEYELVNVAEGSNTNTPK
ncbi:hypothetical protein L7F22_030206 [Adiantum nelumboides]|nr:hypothetical protein [Adiantum nelumboides]